MTTKKNKLVEVEWIDSCSYHRWTDPDHLGEIAVPSDCRSIGYLLVNDKDRIVVVQSLDDDGGSASEAMAIPKVCVKKIRTLK